MEHDQKIPTYEQRVEQLIRQMAEMEAALQGLIGEQVDTVMDPLTGMPMLLRQAQAALYSDQARLGLLLAQIPAIVWTTDRDLVVTSAMGSGLGLIDRLVDDLVGASLPEVVATNRDASRIASMHQLALMGRSATWSGEWDRVAYQAWVEPFRDREGAIIGCLGLAMDISERVRMEEDLRTTRDRLEQRVQERTAELSAANEALRTRQEELLASREELRTHQEELRAQNEELIASRHQVEAERRRYQELFDLAPDGYLITDLWGNIREANRAAARLLNVRQTLLVNKPLVVYIAEQEKKAFRERLLSLQQGVAHEMRDWDLRLRGHRRAPVDVLITVMAVRSPDGELAGLRWLIRDISERVRMEERLRFQADALDQVGDAVIALDERWCVTYINRSAAERYRLDPQADLGHALRELYHYEWPEPEDESAAYAALAEQGRWQGENVHRVRDGHRMVVESTISVLRGSDGQQTGMVAAMRDITARKEAEERSRRYSERLRILHETDEAILAARTPEEVAETVLRQVPRLLSCQRASVALVNLEAREQVMLAAYAHGQEGLSKGQRGLMDHESMLMAQRMARGEIQKYIVDDLQVPASWSPQVARLRAEGVRARVVTALVAQGQLIGTFDLGLSAPGPVPDEQAEVISELAGQLAVGIQQARLYEEVQLYAQELERLVRKRTAALGASEARFRAIFEETAMGIALLNRKGYIIDSNPALQGMLGYSARELYGRRFQGLAHPEEAADDDLFKALMEGRQAYYRIERRYRRQDQKAVDANVTMSLVRPGKGRTRFAIAMIEDITERKQAQMALMQSEGLAITGRLAASLAHEINNPLQSVIGCLGLAQEIVGEGGDASQFMQVAMEELERASRIVRQMRDLHSRPEMHKELADINGLVQKVLLLTKKQCDTRHVEVSWEKLEDLSPLLIVADRIQRVILNLVLNAIDAMPNGGKLQLRTACTEDPSGVEIQIADTGVGIAPELLSHIFEPFQTTKEQGLGLGLYVSRKTVEEHRGRMQVDSVLGHGTMFTVWLPRDNG